MVHGVCNQPLQVEAITLPASSSSSSVTDNGSGSGNGSDGLLDGMGLAALTAAKEPHCCKLFTVGSSSDDGSDDREPLRESELAASLRRTMAPAGYALIGDLALDFPQALEYYTIASPPEARAASATAAEAGAAVTPVAKQRQIEVDAKREALLTWTGREFVCKLVAASGDTEGEDQAPVEPEAVVDVWVVGTKLYAAVG